MDSLTHALIGAILLTLIGRPDLAIYGIMGAVLIDLDVVFGYFSDRDPRLYIFTHGGFTHSFFGASIIGVFIVLLSEAFAIAGILPAFGLSALGAIALGSLSHLAADYLAYPGIPLFYPLSDKKYTLGILGGPSVFIMAGSLIFLASIALGIANISQPGLYVAFFGIVLGLSLIAKCYAVINTKGRTIATMNPLRWLVIEDLPNAYRFYTYDFLQKGSSGHVFEKFKGIDPASAQAYRNLPGLRRMRYHSYLVTVEQTEDLIVYHDPIREAGLIWYPPYYKQFTIPVVKNQQINAA